eukprot:scaffold55399_cov31-Tisochrysis_lutea.AAC.2
MPTLHWEASSRHPPAKLNQVLKRTPCLCLCQNEPLDCEPVVLISYQPCADLCRAYLKQAREELGKRLVQRVYDESGSPSKFWLVFAKRKFMNKQL